MLPFLLKSVEHIHKTQLENVGNMLNRALTNSKISTNAITFFTIIGMIGRLSALEYHNKVIQVIDVLHSFIVITKILVFFKILIYMKFHETYQT